MKTKKPSFSIRLIDSLSHFIFWFFAVVSAIFVLFTLVNIMGLVPSSVDVGVELPTNFTVYEQGTFTYSNTQTAVEIKEASGVITFKSMPRFLSVGISVGVLPLMLALLYILWLFKGFTRSVKLGEIFDISNIKRFKLIAYSVTAVWVYLQLVSTIYNLVVVPKFNFDGVEFGYSNGSFGEMLLFALFLWVLSHIFEKGAEIETDNQLTI
jgi:hypothetical protein